MLEGLQSFLLGIGEDVKTFVTEKPLQTAAIGAAATGAVALGTVAAVKIAKRNKKVSIKKKISKKIKKKKRKLTPLMRRRKKIIARKGRQTPYTARGGKDTSTRRIRQTKHGQPYVILANGRARFISKASAKRSRKLKGGRY